MDRDLKLAIEVLLIVFILGMHLGLSLGRIYG